MKHEFKSENGRWVLVVHPETGFYLYDSEVKEDECVIDASTLFYKEGAWIELLDFKNRYLSYCVSKPDKGNSFGLRLKPNTYVGE